jgi:hypothetical protein
MVLSIEERVFLVAHVFRKGNRYTDLVPDLTPPDFYLWGALKFAAYRDPPRTLNELKIAITAYVRNISQADLQKVSFFNVTVCPLWTSWSPLLVVAEV